MKKLAFDIGDVLCTVDLKPFIKYLYDHRCVFSIPQGEQFLQLIQPRQDIGLCNMAQSLRELNPYLTGYEEATAIWKETIKMSPAMLNLVDELLNDNYEIALLSNIGQEHADIIYKNEILNRCIHHFSYKVGVRKPSRLFFQSFKLSYPGWDNVLFLDDREENVQAANEEGFTAYRFYLWDYTEEDAVKRVKSWIYSST